MLPSPNYEPRNTAQVRLVVLHTSEGARDVIGLGHYLQDPARQASYHVAFDDQRMEQYVAYDQAAWACLSANRISDNGCCCGFAAWTRQEWLTHSTMLELAAKWVADRCTARRIPIRHLSLAEVADCRSDPSHPGGVIGHWDWTRGANDGTHTDPGPNFPWDVVIARAQSFAHIAHRRRIPVYQIAPTPIPQGAAPDAAPDDSWSATEHTVTAPGPAGGWSGRVVMHLTLGWRGGFVQEAWSGPSGHHYVSRYDPAKKTGGAYVKGFDPQSWELPAGDRFLVVRLANPAYGSITPEPEH